jgi:glycosyltransferase involved in cell wall biosynthesis
MRVVVASSSVPHVRGGGTLIVEWTAQALREAGHEVEELYFPFTVDTRRVLPAMVGMRAIPLHGQGDRLITIRWPSHLIRHENKAAWFIHHHRELFDLWDTPYRNIRDDVEAASYRESVRRIDNLGFRECRAVFSNSAIVRDRVAEYNGITPEPLLPPLGGDTSRFGTDAYGDFIFYPSRVTPIKRQLLAVEAMRHTTTPVRLVIGGKDDDTGRYSTRLGDLVRMHGLEDKVDLRLGWMAEDEKTRLLAQCLAVAYLPLDEDSYGYPSLEASHSRKAIVTVGDAGGALEFVRDGVEGLVTAPDARALAAGFDRLYEDRALAERMGEASSARRAELKIDWEHVLARLLGEGSS